MHQQLKDSIRFCYKREETTYEELYRETVEAEKEKNLEVKVTSLKAKSAFVGVDQNGIQDLKQKIDALTTVVKSSTLGGAQLKQNGNGPTLQKEREKLMVVCSRDGDQQLHQLGHSSLDRNLFSVINVGAGDTVIGNV